MAKVEKKQNPPLIYVPEEDGGERARGRAVLSADMWIPLERIADPDAVLMTSVIQTINNRTGNTQTISLARKEAYHLVMNRHLHADWRNLLTEWDTVDLSPMWDHVDFGDGVQLRSAEQVAAWGALHPAPHGILNLACLSGDTMLSLNRAGKEFKMSIAEVAQRWVGGRYGWDHSTQTRIRANVGGRIGLHTIEAVFSNGIRPTVELVLADGKVLRLTEDHQVMTPSGWRSVQDGLAVGDLIMTDGGQSRGGRKVVSTRKTKVAYRRIGGFVHHPHAQAFGYGELVPVELIEIRAGRMEEVYDVTCSEPHHNFVANGVVVHNCGKGKTVLALKKIASRQFPTLVIVNNEGLIDQWSERALQFLDITPDEIGVVQGPKAQWDRPLVLAMIHTLAQRADQIPMSVRKRFGTVVFDEVHHLSATTFLRTAPLFFGNRYGLTATAEREDGLEGAYYANVGHIFHSDLQGDLQATTYFHPTSFALPHDAWQITDRAGQFSVGKLYTYLASLPARNNQILSMALEAASSGRKVLVLTHSAEHPELLKRLFDRGEGGAKNLTSGAISGKTPGPERTQVIQRSNVSFATFQVAREGLDVAALDTVIFATPFKAWGAFQQGKGRIERKLEGKKEPIVVVLEDVGIGPCRGMCMSLRRAIAQHGMRYVDLKQSPGRAGEVRRVQGVRPPQEPPRLPPRRR